MKGDNVKAESHGLAPTVGAVALGPVDGLIIEENHVTFFRWDGDGFELVGMVLIGREVGADKKLLYSGAALRPSSRRRVERFPPSFFELWRDMMARPGRAGPSGGGFAKD